MRARAEPPRTLLPGAPVPERTVSAARTAALPPLAVAEAAAVPLPEVAPAQETELLADLFHALSQPLTALRCALELALDPRRTPGQCREGARAALDHAEQVAALCGGIRALVEAGDGGENPQALALGRMLRESVEDLRPLAEEQGGSLVLREAPAQGWVRFERQRLRQGLFCLLEYALNSGPGAHITVDAGEQEDEAKVQVTVSRAQAAGEPAAEGLAGGQKELQRRLALAIARRLFESAGGKLQVRHPREILQLELSLPLLRIAEPQGQGLL
ncbi:MAG TPA: hypothetical protein VLV49_01670 [Terriglobales bacterium]|nr:hypothetical protein [Terriglobales bacterium]